MNGQQTFKYSILNIFLSLVPVHIIAELLLNYTIIICLLFVCLFVYYYYYYLFIKFIKTSVLSVAEIFCYFHLHVRRQQTTCSVNIIVAFNVTRGKSDKIKINITNYLILFSFWA